MPQSWSPSAEKLEKKHTLSAYCQDKTTMHYDRAKHKQPHTLAEPSIKIFLLPIFPKMPGSSRPCLIFCNSLFLPSRVSWRTC